MRINSIGINQQYNNSYRKVNANPSFRAADPNKELQGASKLLAEKVYPWLRNTKVFQGITTQLSKIDKSFTALLVGESALLSGFYMINTATNKKIKKEQKPQMLINDALTLGVSTAGALFLDDKINNMVKVGTEKYVANRKNFYRGLGADNKNVSENLGNLISKVGEVAKEKGEALTSGIESVTKELGEHLSGLVGKADGLKTFQITKDKLAEVQTSVGETIKQATSSETAQQAVGEKVKGLYADLAARAEADKFAAGMSKVKTLIIFGIIYRYIGPCVVTPIANKLSSKFFSHKKNENNTVNK